MKHGKYLLFMLNFLAFHLGFSAHAEKIIHINSLEQTVLDKDRIIFEKEVEVLFDKKFHIWADRVEVDYTTKVLRALCNDSCAVKVETRDFVILANFFELNLQTLVGSAHDIRIHTADGYISARRAEKIGDHKWSMYDVSYTACDAECAHWQITAREATVCGGCFVKVNWVFLKIGKVPFFVLPKIIVPLQAGLNAKKKGAASGFLVPKFYVDYDSGFGFKQEYYQHFADRCDTIIGVDWREQRGLALFDEFRWVRLPQSYTLVNAHYALARHNFKENNGEILSKTRHRYWISGKDFFSYNIFGARGNSLIQVDFGTDKRIGYQFFDSLEHVDDCFNNTLTNRLLWPRHLLELSVNDQQTSRKRFSTLQEDELKKTNFFVDNLDATIVKKTNIFDVKELENRVSVAAAPSISSHTTYYTLANKLFYRQDFFCDQMLYREQEFERIYRSSLLAEEKKSVPLKKAQVIRFDYRGFLETSLHGKGNTFTAGFYPILQMRSLLPQDCYLHNNVVENRLFAQGSQRFLCGYGAEWSLPDIAYNDYSYNYLYSLQPLVRWDYVPLFDQRHWYFMDERDYIFPKHQVEASLTQHIFKEASSFELSMVQGYEFNKNQDILPLRQSLSGNHLLPLQLRLQGNSSFFHGYFQQEYDFQDFRLLNTEIITGITVDKVNFNVGYLFQPRAIQFQREFLSNISHFVLVDFMIPVGKSSTLQYAGQFYVEKGYRFMDLAGIKPLLHTIRFDYAGHCCGFYIGYEEKKYREFGHDKHERAIVFSLRLNSLGSFAKRFKRPQIMDSNKINDEDLYGLA